MKTKVRESEFAVVLRNKQDPEAKPQGWEGEMTAFKSPLPVPIEKVAPVPNFEERFPGVKRPKQK